MPIPAKSYVPEMQLCQYIFPYNEIPKWFSYK